MIDIHAHILPGIDDGARNIDESLEMCSLAVKDGIDTIVATPHTGNGTFYNSRDSILAAVEDLNSRIKDRGVPVKVLPGADNYVSQRLGDLIERGKAMTVNDRRKYVMVEFPRSIMPPQYLDWLFSLKIKGIIPIFTHPERNSAVQTNLDIIYEWVHRGGQVQITAMSLTSFFGPAAKKCAEDLLRSHLVHVIASDAHSREYRPPVLSEAVAIAGSLAGVEYARKLVEDYPAAIIAGESFSTPPPARKKGAKRVTFFGRLLKGLRAATTIACA